MSPAELRSSLEVVRDMAVQLRNAGITSIRVSDGEMTATFAPAEPPDPAAPVADSPPTAVTAPPEIDPLDDPATYGTDEVPGYDLDKELTE